MGQHASLKDVKRGNPPSKQLQASQIIMNVSQITIDST